LSLNLGEEEMAKTVYRYSEAFKLKVVNELELGHFGSPHEAAEAYGIRGRTTVPRWAKAYGKRHLLGKVVRVEKDGEPGELARLKKRIRALEHQLGEANVDRSLKEGYFELLCKAMEIDPEAFKKKHAGNASIMRISGEEAGEE
jgi:transposase-like protein